MEQRFRALVRSLPLWRLLPRERLRRAEEGLRRSERGDFEGFREAAREVVHAMDEAVGGSWLTDYALDTIDRCQDRREVLEGARVVGGGLRPGLPGASPGRGTAPGGGGGRVQRLPGPRQGPPEGRGRGSLRGGLSFPGGKPPR